MARDSVSYDTLQRLHFGKYSGERLCDLPEGYLHWLLCHADNAAAKGPKFRRSVAWALFNRTNAKLRETFGSTLAERVGGFPEPPPGWESAGSCTGGCPKVSPPAFPRLSHGRERITARQSWMTNANSQ